MIIFLLGLPKAYFRRTYGGGVLRKQFLTPLIVFIAMSLQGCVSLLAQSDLIPRDKECSFPLYTYGGTITSSGLLVTSVVSIPENPINAVMLGGLVAVDFPYTVAMDTLTLPLSVVRDIKACTKRYSKKKPQYKERPELAASQEVSDEVSDFWYEPIGLSSK